MSTKPTRAERIQAIRDTGRVREALRTEGALHRPLPDGSHEIVWRGHRFVGRTLPEVIRAADQARMPDPRDID